MLSDRQLLDVYCAHRDAEAFSVLVNRHSQMVYRTCLRICRNSANAEDATQECFLTLARQAVRITASLPAWLHRVATRAALRMKASRSVALAEDVAIVDAVDSGWMVMSDRIDEAMNGLPDDLSAVLVLHFFEGKVQQEIAAALLISQPTVQRRLAKGIARLRERLGDGGAHSLVLPLLVAEAAAPKAVPASAAQALGKIALVGVAPLPSPVSSWLVGMLAKCLAFVLAGAAIFFVLRVEESATPPSSVNQARTVAEQSPAMEADRDPVLDATISADFANSGLSETLQEIGALVRRHGLDLWMAAPYDTAWDERPLRIHAAEQTVRSVLDDIARQAQLRWHRQDNWVLFDRPLDLPRVEALLRALGEAGDQRAAFSAARELLRTGDLTAIRTMMLLLDHETPERCSGIVAALQQHVPIVLPIEWSPFLVDDEVRAALAAWWQRLPGEAVTPFSCFLVGIARVQGAQPRLRELFRDPRSERPELADPACDVLCHGIRASAAFALGRIGDVDSLAAIGDYAVDSVHGLMKLATIEALGAYRSPSAMPYLRSLWELHADEYDIRRLDEAIYVATVETDRSAIAELFAARDPLCAGKAIYHWQPSWIRRPVEQVIRSVLEMNGMNKGVSKWYVETPAEALVRGCLSLPRERGESVLQDELGRVTEAASRIAILLALATYGREEAWTEALQMYSKDRSVPVAGKAFGLVLRHRAGDKRTSDLLKRVSEGDPACDQFATILASVDDPTANRWLIEHFEKFPTALKTAVAEGLLSSVDPAVVRFRQSQLEYAEADAVESWLGDTQAEFDHALELIGNEHRVDKRSCLFTSLFYRSRLAISRFERLLGYLESIDDTEFLASCLRHLRAHYAIQAIDPVDQTERFARLLVGWTDHADTRVRHGAAKCLLRWAHNNGPSKIAIVNAMRQAAIDPEDDVTNTGRAALQNFSKWYSGWGQSANSWITVLHGEEDDVVSLREIRRLLALPDPVRPEREGPKPDNF
jgi:RNA polymerase sigma factor (sigma-70 family)